MPDAFDERLVAYVSGELGESQAVAFERELAQDAGRRDLVDRLRGLVNAIPAESGGPTEAAVRRVLDAFAIPVRVPAPEPPGWLAALDRVVARLVFDGRGTPALAGFRGGAGGALAFESDLGRLDLDLRPIDPTGADSWRVRGQFRGEVAPRRVALVVSDGTAIHEGQADERGGFVLECPPGTHALVLEIGEAAFVVDELVIG